MESNPVTEKYQERAFNALPRQKGKQFKPEKKSEKTSYVKNTVRKHSLLQEKKEISYECVQSHTFVWSKNPLTNQQYTPFHTQKLF